MKKGLPILTIKYYLSDNPETDGNPSFQYVLDYISGETDIKQLTVVAKSIDAVQKNSHHCISRYKDGKNVTAVLELNASECVVLTDRELIYLTSAYDRIYINVNNVEDLSAAKHIITLAKDISKTRKSENITVYEKLSLKTDISLSNIFILTNIGDLATVNNISWKLGYKVPSATSIDNLYGDFIQAEKLALSKYVINKQHDCNHCIYSNGSVEDCPAGISHCEILENGSIVSCIKTHSPVIEGNISSKSLKDIWANGFKKERYEEHSTCIDILQDAMCVNSASEKEQQKHIRRPAISKHSSLDTVEVENKKTSDQYIDENIYASDQLIRLGEALAIRPNRPTEDNYRPAT